MQQRPRETGTGVSALLASRHQPEAAQNETQVTRVAGCPSGRRKKGSGGGGRDRARGGGEGATGLIRQSLTPNAFFGYLILILGLRVITLNRPGCNMDQVIRRES